MRLIMIIILLSLCCCLRFTGVSAQISISGMQDIAKLLEDADRTFDLSQQDAVVLFDGHREDWMPDGRLNTFVHRIIWINSAVAIRTYGDHRIPFDSDRRNFIPVTVRTWRDGQWWESDTTGIVETLPHAVRKAYDYSGMLEMMLLHNGIELPCVLEIAYIIQDKEPFRKGAEGMWVFAEDDPVVLSWFMIGFPSGIEPNVFASEGVSKPEIEHREDAGIDVYKYSMNSIDALPTPHTADPASYSPHIVWSTWKSWDRLGSDIRKAFDESLCINDALQDSVRGFVDRSRTPSELAKDVSDYVNRSTRLIKHPALYLLWNNRPADRVYESAYGSRSDRAVLAAVLFQEAGFMVFPVYRGMGYGSIGEGIASLARFDGAGVWISGPDEVEAYFDPVSGRLSNGLAPIFGRTVWIPGSGEDPQVNWSGEGTKSLFELKIKIKLDEEAGEWTGSGFYHVTHGFNSFDRMEGVEHEARDFVQSVLTGTIDGAEVENYNPVTFNRFTVKVGFRFKASIGDKDGRERLRMRFREPGNGLTAMLPGDVELHREDRESLLRLPGLMTQKIEIEVDVENMNILYLPGNRRLENSQGQFTLTIELSEETVRIARDLELTSAHCEADRWTDLRELLLAETHEHNQTMIVELNDDR